LFSFSILRIFVFESCAFVVLLKAKFHYAS